MSDAVNGLVELEHEILASVARAGREGDDAAQILVGRTRAGGIAIIDRDELGRYRAGKAHELDDILKVAENALAMNPRALTWPPALRLVSAGLVALVALLEREPSGQGEPPSAAPQGPAASA
jgi:hypothetical protein